MRLIKKVIDDIKEHVVPYCISLILVIPIVIYSWYPNYFCRDFHIIYIALVIGLVIFGGVVRMCFLYSYVWYARFKMKSAVVLFNKGKTDEAIQYLEKLEKKSHSKKMKVLVITNIARFYDVAGNRPKAIETYLRAKTYTLTDTELIGIHLSLCMLYFYDEDTMRANELFEITDDKLRLNSQKQDAYKLPYTICRFYYAYYKKDYAVANTVYKEIDFSMVSTLLKEKIDFLMQIANDSAFI